MEHRLLWEDANGPIPDGHFIHHLNHVPTDNRLENLVLVVDNATHHRTFHSVRPDTQREGVSRAHKGKPKSPEHRAAIAAANRGKPKSAEHRAKLSAALIGKPRPDLSAILKGRILTGSQRENIVAAAKRRPRDPISGRFM